jgi:Co/Zn/Cd efflux system component
VNVIGLYGLYIFWAGAEKMLNPPQNKKTPLLIAGILVMVVIFTITDLILTKLIDIVYYAFFV